MRNQSNLRMNTFDSYDIMSVACTRSLPEHSSADQLYDFHMYQANRDQSQNGTTAITTPVSGIFVLHIRSSRSVTQSDTIYKAHL